MEEHYKQGESSISWFKLALLVSRGEKEKALGLYKILSYSFNDKAYALQVEGDLLWAFEDKEALIKYQQAALLYKTEKNYAAAIGIYEHLLVLDRYNAHHLSMLFELYALIYSPQHLERCVERLAAWVQEHKLDRNHIKSMIKPAIDLLYERAHHDGLELLRRLLGNARSVLGDIHEMI